MWVYIVECSDGSYYTGVTRDLIRRIEQHNHSNYGAEYTKLRRPVKLVYSKLHRSHAEAYRQERAIKGFDHDWKRRLIEQNKYPDNVVYVGSGKS